MFSDAFMKFLLEYQAEEKNEITDDIEASRREMFDQDLFAKKQPVVIPVYFLK